MKVGSGELDLGFFIDRTIKQCLEYDLITSDTDAVLEDMAKAWPAKQDTVCPPCATGVRRDLSSGSKEDVRRFNSNSISNNIKADRTASPETSLSLTSKQSHQLSVDDLKMGDPGLPNHRDSPVENLSMSTRSRGVEDHTSLVEGNRESPVGQVAGEGRRGSLRKSHSCEELMGLGGQGRSDHDGCQASSSPEMTSVGSSSRVSSSPEMTTVASSSRVSASPVNSTHFNPVSAMAPRVKSSWSFL
ncbi:hypothetical protein RRG08_047087 [Elysia crispata]|uniref:Uncharacterized protein n=1 Tax=Elysia crispata TaxID=231223 RepID=A0AAE1A9X8_9GAST|nr:hypothetical protein RRG08_047087 [Elysia crispata]